MAAITDRMPYTTEIAQNVTYWLTSHADGRVEVHAMPTAGGGDTPAVPHEVKMFEKSFRAKGHSPQNAAMMARLKAARTKKR